MVTSGQYARSTPVKVYLVRYSADVLLILTCSVLAIIVIIMVYEFMDGNDFGTHS